MNDVDASWNFRNSGNAENRMFSRWTPQKKTRHIAIDASERSHPTGLSPADLAALVAAMTADSLVNQDAETTELSAELTEVTWQKLATHVQEG